MADESPPPYSAVVADPLVKLPIPESPNVGLPFSSSDNLAAKLLALISEGKTLDSHFRDVRDIASAGSVFDCHESAVILCQTFETLVWESRNIASTALVAIRDFNDVVLDFLSQPDAVIQDRLQELANASKLLQLERDSSANQNASFDTLIEQLEEFYRSVFLESDAPNPKKLKQSPPEEMGTAGMRPSRKLIPPAVPHGDPFSGFSSVTASIGLISRTVRDYAQHFELKAEQAVFPSCIRGSAPRTPAATRRDPNLSATPSSNPSIRKRLGSAIARDELTALPDLVGALLRDLRAFVGRVGVFNTVLAELARAQDVFILYLKDGQSVANQGYRSEITRLRGHLPRVCNALDAYSKGRLFT